MSENKFTEGEWFAMYSDGYWQVCENKKYQLELATVENDTVKNSGVVATPDRFKSFEECKVIAQLLAAAPDLLAACETALERLKSINGSFENGNEFDEEIAELQKAIAKARGNNDE